MGVLHILMKWFPLSLTKNIDTQEQLLNALESLKQHQETINTLKMKATEEMSDHLPVRGREGSSNEAEQKVKNKQPVTWASDALLQAFLQQRMLPWFPQWWTVTCKGK